MPKCLSIKQPWASWICPSDAIKKLWDKDRWPALPKIIENREWSVIPKYRGPLLIHASKTIDQDAWNYFDDMEPYIGGHDEYPTGVIIGQVNLSGIEFGSMSEWYNPGCIALIFDSNKRFDTFYSIPGQLGIFEVNESIFTKGQKMEERPPYGDSNEWKKSSYIDEKGNHILVVGTSNNKFGIFRVTSTTDEGLIGGTRKVRGTDTFDKKEKAITALNRLAVDRRWEQWVPEDPEEVDPENLDPENEPADSEENNEPETEAVPEKKEKKPLPTEKLLDVPVEPSETEKKMRRLIIDIQRLEEEKKISNKRFRDEIDDLMSQLSSLAEGRSMTQKICDIEYDWQDGVKRYIDPDDGSVVETVAITDDDRYQQTTLDLDHKEDEPVDGEVEEDPNVDEGDDDPDAAPDAISDFDTDPGFNDDEGPF